MLGVRTALISPRGSAHERNASLAESRPTTKGTQAPPKEPPPERNPRSPERASHERNPRLTRTSPSRKEPKTRPRTPARTESKPQPRNTFREGNPTLVRRSRCAKGTQDSPEGATNERNPTAADPGEPPTRNEPRRPPSARPRQSRSPNLPGRSSIPRSESSLRLCVVARTLVSSPVRPREPVPLTPASGNPTIDSFVKSLEARPTSPRMPATLGRWMAARSPRVCHTLAIHVDPASPVRTDAFGSSQPCHPRPTIVKA
jgi:hypothetical protein